MICDTTLRDGEQMPGVVFSPREKFELANRSSKFGSNFIELMPSVSSSEKKLAKRLMKKSLSAKITASTLLRKDHVDLALDCGIEHITLFTSVSDIHLENKLKISREDNIARSLEIIDFAKSHGLTVAFAGEDSTRADIDYLVEFINALSNKVDYFLPCDTMGCLTPFHTYDFIKKIKNKTSCKIALHAHNDYGLATANTLAGLMAGAEIFSGTFNGIGERCGNAPIEEVCAGVRFLYGIDLNVKLELLTGICSDVARYSGVALQKHKPIVGENAFKHESGIHVDGVLKNPFNYENFDPVLVGQKSNIVFGKHSGKNALRNIFGHELTNDELEVLLEKIKKLSEKQKKPLTKQDIRTHIATMRKKPIKKKRTLSKREISQIAKTI